MRLGCVAAQPYLPSISRHYCSRDRGDSMQFMQVNTAGCSMGVTLGGLYRYFETLHSPQSASARQLTVLKGAGQRGDCAVYGRGEGKRPSARVFQLPASRAPLVVPHTPTPSATPFRIWRCGCRSVWRRGRLPKEWGEERGILSRPFRLRTAYRTTPVRGTRRAASLC